MEVAGEEVDLDELTTRIERCETLAGRARAQTSFAPAVVQHVVKDLYSRRAQLLDELRRALPLLERRCAEHKTRREHLLQQVSSLGFRIDEIELRTAIGDLDSPDQAKQAKLALDEAELQLAALTEDTDQLEQLLDRCRGVDPADPPPPDDGAFDVLGEIGSLEGLSFQEDEEDERDERGEPDEPEEIEAGAEEDEESPRPAQLLVNEGSPTEQWFPLDKNTVSIGRGKESDSVVRGDSKVSRLHLTLYQEDGVWWAKDMNSANKTLVNGEVSELRRLYGGEELIIGETFLRFRYE